MRDRSTADCHRCRDDVWYIEKNPKSRTKKWKIIATPTTHPRPYFPTTTGWHSRMVKTFCWLKFGMHRLSAWAEGSYSGGPSADRTVGTKTTGGFHHFSVSPCTTATAAASTTMKWVQFEEIHGLVPGFPYKGRWRIVIYSAEST